MNGSSDQADEKCNGEKVKKRCQDSERSSRKFEQFVSSAVNSICNVERLENSTMRNESLDDEVEGPEKPFVV